MVQISLKHGLFTLVDDSDFPEVQLHSWHARKGPRPYVQASVKTADGFKNVLLHRFLLSPPDGMLVDHIDGNPLNNTRANLRLATPAQNAAHRTRPNRGRFIGAYAVPSGKWVAVISPAGKSIYLGTYTTEEAAAAAYNKAARHHFGAYAGQNPVQEMNHG